MNSLKKIFILMSIVRKVPFPMLKFSGFRVGDFSSVALIKIQHTILNVEEFSNFFYK